MAPFQSRLPALMTWQSHPRHSLRLHAVCVPLGHGERYALRARTPPAREAIGYAAFPPAGFPEYRVTLKKQPTALSGNGRVGPELNAASLGAELELSWRGFWTCRLGVTQVRTRPMASCATFRHTNERRSMDAGCVFHWSGCLVLCSFGRRGVTLLEWKVIRLGGEMGEGLRLLESGF